MTDRVVVKGVSFNVHRQSETEIQVRIDFPASSQLPAILLEMTRDEFVSMADAFHLVRTELTPPTRPTLV